MTDELLPDGTPVEDWMKHPEKTTEQIKEEFHWMGFTDAFQGRPCRAVSNYVEPQTSYFDGFTAGKKHLEQVLEVLKEEYPDDPMGMNKLMVKMFEAYISSRRREGTASGSYPERSGFDPHRED